MNIAVYGAGSMGTILGAFLGRAGVEVDLISRDKAHIDALKKAGAKIGGTVSFTTQPFDGANGRGLAMLPGEMNKKYDIIFLLTKQTENAATAAMLENFVTPDGVVCTMQNGFPEPVLADILGKTRVIGCICVWGGTITGPGTVVLTSKPGSMLFNLDGKAHPMLQNMKEILEKVCTVTAEPNFTGSRWSKLLLNAAFSGLSAVTGYSFGMVASQRRSRNLAVLVLKECIEVCRASGIRIEPVQGKFSADFLYCDNPLKKALLSFIMPLAMKNHHAIMSGMLRDIDRGRPCEIDFINGAVSRAGRACNVPTPVNDRIVEIVHSIERGERKYGAGNLDTW